MAATTAAIIGATAAAKGAIDQGKAAKAAANAAQTSQGGQSVNIPQVAQQAHDQAVQNAYDSAELERKLNPLAPQLREQSLQELISQLNNGGGQYDAQVQSSLFDQFNQNPATIGDSALSNAARERALQELALGGQLPQDVANQIIRSSAAKAGMIGGNLGLGRDISARDLGLNSLQLLQQRMATAGQLGSQQDQFNLSRQNQLMQAQQQRANLGFGLNAIGQQGFQRALAASQFGQSIAQPVTGLDPSAIANLAVGNSNQAGAAAQNAAAIRAQAASGTAQLGGQLLGFGLNAFANRSQPKTNITMQPGATYSNSSWSPPANTPSYTFVR